MNPPSSPLFLVFQASVQGRPGFPFLAAQVSANLTLPYNPAPYLPGWCIEKVSLDGATCMYQLPRILVPTLSLQHGSSTPYHAVPSVSHISRLVPLSHPSSRHFTTLSPTRPAAILLLLALDSCSHRRQPPLIRLAARPASSNRNSTASPETSNPLLITAIYSPTHTDHATGWHILPCLGRPTASC